MNVLGNLTQFVRRRLAGQSTQWPFRHGDYLIVDATAPIVVATAGNELPRKELAASVQAGLCMIARLPTVGDTAALLHALATNLAIEHVICTSSKAAPQPLCDALLLLGQEKEAPEGPVGALMNTITARTESGDLKAVRRRVQFIDLLGCTDVRKIAAKVDELAHVSGQANAGFVAAPTQDGIERIIVPRDVRYEARPDKTGQFRIRIEEQSIVVEHLNGKDRPLRIIEGKTARDLCLTLIRNGWVSRLDHAAYLGRELTRAELALRSGQRFVPDSTEPNTLQLPANGG